MECVVVCPCGVIDVIAPGGVFAACEMAAVNSVLEGVLSKLRRLVYTWIAVPAIPLPFADVRAAIAIDIAAENQAVRRRLFM